LSRSGLGVFQGFGLRALPNRPSSTSSSSRSCRRRCPSRRRPCSGAASSRALAPS
jgi:hypothetical protein